MSILSDGEIAELAIGQEMIVPFIDNCVRVEKPSPSEFGLEDDVVAFDKKVISYGLSSFGYDVRLSNEFRVFTNINPGIIDPKNFDEECLVTKISDDFIVIPPNSYALGRTIEYFKIPRDVMVICLGKSTYARAGLIVNVTPIEAGFEGHVVIEVSNSTPLPIKVYANEGISQFVFFRGQKECNVSYADRAGKYQGQTGVTMAKV